MTLQQAEPTDMAPGAQLRHWRQQRHLTQQDLALEADVSTRHLSFVETGRSQPTREMIIRLCEHLDVPLRHRNEILLAAGLAPAYTESTLSQPTMRSVSDAMIRILDGHLPFPALVVDRHWTMIDSNAAIADLIDGCAPTLLEPPVNVLRLSLHPDGLAPRIRNLPEWRGHLLSRLDHQIRATADPELSSLRTELAAYPGGISPPQGDSLVVPLRLDTPRGAVSLLSTTTVFGTPLDVTVAELAIESFFPADDRTGELLRSAAGQP